jgi:hypothetical protein
MKRYRTYLTSHGSLAVPDPIRVHSPQAVVTIENWLEQGVAELPPRHLGLVYSVELTAETIEAAMEASVKEVTGFIDLLAAIHGAAIGDASPSIAFDLDERAADREFAQYIYEVPQVARPNRLLSGELFDLVFAKLNLHAADAEVIGGVHRAVHAARRATLTDNLRDKFVDLWGALEALNPLVQRKHSLPTSQIIRNCRECGAGMSGPVSSGIRYVVDELLGEPAQWKPLRDTRQQFVHGIAVSVDAEQVQSLVRVLHDAFITGLMDVLDIPERAWAKYRGYALGLGSNALLIVVAILRDLPLSHLLAPERPLPFFEMVATSATIEGDPIQGTGQVETGTAEFLIRNFVGNYTIVRAAGVAHRDPADSSGSFTFDLS